jgi:hypothetical protein
MYPRKDHKKQDSEKKTGSLMPREEGAAESMDDFLSSLMLLNSLKSRKSSNYYEIDHETAMKFLLLEYRKQLIEAVEFMKARNENVPQKIEQAIKHIDDQSGWQHWVGKR